MFFSLKTPKALIIVITKMKVRGMALFPFILIRNPDDKKDIVLINHEKIHLRQQAELLIFLFYIWYLTEYFFYRFKGLGHYKSYMSISFEKEAYNCEKDINYLKKRQILSFLKYY